MSYIFSSNGNNYTFKKLDNMLINMPEKDGHHVLIRETVDGVPQYSWGSAACIVKANEHLSSSTHQKLPNHSMASGVVMVCHLCRPDRT